MKPTNAATPNPIGHLTTLLIYLKRLTHESIHAQIVLESYMLHLNPQWGLKEQSLVVLKEDVELVL